MQIRPDFPAARIGRNATIGLLLVHFLLSVAGTEILGGRSAATALIWPASGVGLALVLLRGAQAWYFVFGSALAASLLTVDANSLPQLVTRSAFSAATSAVEPLIAAWLIWRVAGEAFAERAAPFVLAMIVAVPVAAFISAAPLVLGELTAGVVAARAEIGFGAAWYSAAISDLMGMLSLTPAIWIWARDPGLGIGRWAGLELFVFAVAVAAVLVMPEAAQARYLLVAVHLAVALRFPLKWASLAVALTSFVYLWVGSLELRGQPVGDIYSQFLDNVTFVIILNLASYVTALLQRETANRAAQLTQLARALGETEERERKRLAAVLHDNLQQILVVAKMTLSRRPDEISERAQSEIDKAIEVARTLMVDLHPPALEHKGLVPALQWLAEETREQTEISVDVQADSAAEPPFSELRYFLFQTARELLLNVAKHAETDRAWVRLRQQGGWLELEVEDRGQGCPPEMAADRQEEARHFGLASIRRRVELYGGGLSVSSGEGCRVSIRLPLSERER